MIWLIAERCQEKFEGEAKDDVSSFEESLCSQCVCEAIIVQFTDT